MLTSQIIEGFVGSLLVKNFDGSLAIPEIHREWWDLCCSKEKFVAIAAPRSHAKSTAITFSYVLASVLFRERSYVLIVSDTETQACLFLGSIKQELQQNEDIIKLFGLKKNNKGEVAFVKDSESDIVVELDDGHLFRIMAKGSEQKLRGLLWNGKRPDMIVCHEEGTDIYTPETGWIKNNEYPNATRLKTQEAYKVTFEDGTTEVVSGDHRYLTKGGWKYIWEMKNGESVEENITDDIMNVILNAEKNHSENITIKKRLKKGLQSGLRIITISMLLLKINGQRTISNIIKTKLKNIGRNILVGWQTSVRRGEVKS